MRTEILSILSLHILVCLLVQTTATSRNPLQDVRKQVQDLQNIEDIEDRNKTMSVHYGKETAHEENYGYSEEYQLKRHNGREIVYQRDYAVAKTHPPVKPPKNKKRKTASLTTVGIKGPH